MIAYENMQQKVWVYNLWVTTLLSRYSFRCKRKYFFSAYQRQHYI